VNAQPAQPPRRGIFDRFAESATEFVSTGAFFGMSVLLVVLWLPTIFFITSVDTWQLVLNTAVSVLAFLLVALLQNSERRYDIALHRKVDAIAAGLAALMRQQPGADRSELEEEIARLCTTIGLEERV
jgi:low affinity Fe/Cu permease